MQNLLRTVLFCAFSALAAPGVCADQAPRDHPVRILFIGNSYTYFNNLPELLTKLAKAGGQGEVQTKMLAPGGTRLKDHWETGPDRAELTATKWDYVVLQDQSTLGVTYLFNGADRVTSDAVFRPYAEKWASAVRQAGAVPVFFVTWARKASPSDQAVLNFAYLWAARDTKSSAAPVGMAWADVRKHHPEIELFYRDGSHPSPAGSYLAACTLYRTIFHKSPIGLPAIVRGEPVDLDTELPEPGKTAVLADLKPAEARVLQAAAETACRRLERMGRNQRWSRPAAPYLRPLPEGEPLSAMQIEGRWHGKLRLPGGPAEMILTLAHKGIAWTARLELLYHQKGRDDKAVDLDLVEADDRQVVMTDFGRLTGVKLQFTAVAVSPYEMVGIVEGAFDTDGAPGNIYGSWSVRR